jgi:CRP/FNR family transcriptional activator FtrB
MPESYHREVRALPLFSGMEPALFDTLMRGTYVQNFPPQIDLIHEGDPSDFLHVVLSGSVDLYAGWNGRETSMATVRPVSTFILAATVRDAPYLMSARTLEKSRIALIPSQDVREIFALDGMFARSVVTELAQCYRSVIKTQKDLARTAGELPAAPAAPGGRRAGVRSADGKAPAGVVSGHDTGKPQPGVQGVASLRGDSGGQSCDDRQRGRPDAAGAAQPADRRSLLMRTTP